MSRLKLLTSSQSWAEAEKQWDRESLYAKETHPIKRLQKLPQMPGITSDTAKNLKWKSLVYLLRHPRGKTILKHYLKHPFRYGIRYLISVLKKKSYERDGDFFLYGLKSSAEWEKVATDPASLFVVGFSYCQKPFECPDGRFTKGCRADGNNPVCKQCDIGKIHHFLPERAQVLIIPTVHDIGEALFELTHQHPKKQIVFLITACEMTLEMFGDWGHLLGAKGIGVRLDGRICNTMKAFELSEEGIKPGLTVVTEETQGRILTLIRKIQQ